MKKIITIEYLLYALIMGIMMIFTLINHSKYGFIFPIIFGVLFIVSLKKYITKIK